MRAEERGVGVGGRIYPFEDDELVGWDLGGLSCYFSRPLITKRLRGSNVTLNSNDHKKGRGR